MTVVPLNDEEGRIAALYRYDLLKEGAHNELLKGIAKAAQAALGTDKAGVTIIDRAQVHYRAVLGMPVKALARERTICDRVVRAATPIAMRDAESDVRYADLRPVLAESAMRSYCGVPLATSDGFVAGTIFVADTQERTFNEDAIATLTELAKVAIQHLELQHMARYDFLSGAVTRRTFQFEVEREYDRAKRYDRPAALVFMDIDQFRKLNEAFGHGAGDEALRAIANRCMETMRGSDVFGRVGGEEFAMLLPETLAYEASQCAERLRELVGQLRFKTDQGVLALSASFGVSALGPKTASAAQWFADADIALYGAKQAGGNAVMIASPERTAQPVMHESAPSDAAVQLH